MDRLACKEVKSRQQRIRMTFVMWRLLFRTSESEGSDNAHLKRVLLQVLFVYILAFLADGVLTNHFQNCFCSPRLLGERTRMIIIAVVKLHDWPSQCSSYSHCRIFSGRLLLRCRPIVYMALFAVIVRIINLDFARTSFKNPIALGPSISLYLSFT